MADEQQQGDPIDYRTIPALAQYIDRIGAEQINPRKFMIKSRHGNYYKEVAVIRITAELDIKCSSPAFAPTKEEVAGIKAALQMVADKFPRSVPVSLEKALREVGHRRKFEDSTLFPVFDIARKQVIMVEERSEDKEFRTWTFWSDDRWRMMEPDGSLPFWKPPKPKGVGPARIMVHEGAKSAMAAVKIVEEHKDHPWWDELRLYEHWGILGGALAPHRSDYSEIREMKPDEVVYFCDNDDPGKTMAAEFSRHYQSKMRAVKLPNLFEVGWDMGNNFNYKGELVPLPERAAHRLGAYMEPATWATEVVNTGPRGGKTSYRLTRDFAAEWVHVVQPEVYINIVQPGRVYRNTEFDHFVRPYSNVKMTSELVKMEGATRAAELRYNPGMEKGLIPARDGKGLAVNTHEHSEVYQETVKRMEKGEKAPSWKPWLDYMERLIPSEKDREHTYRWIATLIAHPEVHMSYSLLLTGPQGVGKSTLGANILEPIIGHINCSTPTEEDITDSEYNYWQPLKRLAIVHEIYAGHSSRAYNKLKNVTAGDDVEIKQKYLAAVKIENWVHVIACSNSMKPLQLEGDDRRWLVPELTEDIGDPGYWEKLNWWLVKERGHEAIIRWAFDYIKKHKPIKKADKAPDTDRKRQVKEEGYSPGQEYMASVLNMMDSILKDGEKIINSPTNIANPRDDANVYEGSPFFIDVDMVEQLRREVHGGRTDKLEKKATVCKLAKNLGWYVSKVNLPWKLGQEGEWGFGGSRAAHMICRDKADADGLEGLERITSTGRKPINIRNLCSKYNIKGGADL